MPDVLQLNLVASAATTTGTKTPVNVRGLQRLSLFLSAVGGTSAVLTVEMTTDPLGETGWTLAGYRETAGSGSYATTALTVVPATARSIYLHPDDAPAWVRLNVSANTGPTTLSGLLQAARLN